MINLFTKKQNNSANHEDEKKCSNTSLIQMCLEEINQKEKYKKQVAPKVLDMEYSEFIRYSENMQELANQLGLKFFDFKKEIPQDYQILNVDNKYLIENNIFCLEVVATKDRYLLLHDISNIDLNKLKDVEVRDIALASLHTMNLLLSQNNEIKTSVDAKKGATDYMNELFNSAKINRASDVKLSLKSFQLIVRMLTANGWRRVSTLDRKQAEIVRSYLEVKSSVESGSMRFDSTILYNDDELRINFFTTAHGWRATIRLPNADFKSFNSLKDIGYTDDVEEIISDLALSKNGMLIFSAPTGNGKTTTQNIVLDNLAKSGREVVSVEHPVERSIAGIDQVDTSVYETADEENKITSKTILKDFLRAKPDVINAGELRDAEDYNIAKEIALTGHLLIASTHSISVKTTIQRMLNDKLSVDDIKSLLRGIICQTLVRKLCSHCKIKDGKGGYKSSQVGCKHCKYGYDFNKTPIVEVASFKIFEDWDIDTVGSYKNYVSLEANANAKYDLGFIDAIHRDALIGGKAEPQLWDVVDEKYLDDEDQNPFKVVLV